MKWLTMLLLTGLVLKQTSDAISVEKTSNGVKLQCTDDGKWEIPNTEETILPLENKDWNSGERSCTKSQIYVKFRTCDNCVELDVISIVGIIVGNVLASFLIGVAVYSLSAQPRTKSISGSKASDKKALLSNGENDTYQPLTSGQTSEYSALGGRRK